MTLKIVYILSKIDRALAYEWISEKINTVKFDLSFILLNDGDSYLEQYLKAKNVKVSRIRLISKKFYPVAFFKLIFKLLKTNPDIVHTHMQDASFLGQIAAKLTGIKKRIYTRHHSTFHHDNYPKAVKWDKLINYLSTDIIAISENVKNVLINHENVPLNKIHLIHHGFDLNSFSEVKKEKIEELRNKYKISKKHPVIGVIARYINLKGHKYIIHAFQKILNEYPNSHFIFANAEGSDKKEIQKIIKTYLPDDAYSEIIFEKNLFELYKLFDVFVHTPINREVEAFGQTYIEALAAGIPAVFTMSGVASEFIIPNENALVIDYCNSEQLYNAILRLLKDKNLKDKLINNGKRSIQQFDLEKYIEKLELLYSS